MHAKQLFTNDHPEMANSARLMAALIVMQTKCWAYYSILLTCPIIWTRKVPTAGTDGAYVYVNPDFFLGLPTDGQRAFLLAHEVGHIVLRHPGRGLAYRKRGFFSYVGTDKISFIHRYWNMAGDYVINADLIAHGLEPIPEGLYSSKFGRDDLVDNVYLDLYEEPEEGEGGEGGEGGESDEPNGTPSNPGGEGDSDDDTSEESDEAGESGGDAGDDEGDEGDEGEAGGDSDGDDAGEGSDQDGGSDGDDGSDQDGDDAGDSGDDSDDGSDQNGKGKGKGKSQPGEDGESEDGEGEAVATDHDGHDSHFEPRYDADSDEEAEQQAAEDRAEIQRRVDEALDMQDEMRERGEQHGASSKGFGQSGFRHDGNTNASQTDWRMALADYVTRSGRDGDLDWSRVRRMPFMLYRAVMPSRKGTLDRIAIIDDCSGSVSMTRRRQFRTELAALLDLMQPTSGCLVLPTDTSVITSEVAEVFSGQELLDLTVPYGGGTIMGAGVRYMEENGLEADVTLCFTDGDLWSSEDWDCLANAGVVMVLDRKPDVYTQREIDRCGITVIVCDDTPAVA